MRRIVNVPDVSPADDRFVELDADWVRLSGLPANAIERAIRRPRLSRYRAAWQAAGAAVGDAAVISHMPLMTAAVERALALRGRTPAHLAFSFNFTKLPGDPKRKSLAKAFSRVARFAVYSAYERGLYARYFDIDPARIEPVVWTQDTPELAADFPRIEGPYLCAIGGEGRDFPTLLKAFAGLPNGIGAVLIARPHSLVGLTVPSNVRVFANLPPPQTWAMANGSLGVLVPLLSRETCCGQVTLVSAKLLGLPMVTSVSEATGEYVDGRAAILQTEPGDVGALLGAIERLADDRDALRAAAISAVPHERAIHDRSIWSDYIARFLNDTA